MPASASAAMPACNACSSVNVAAARRDAIALL
jgi:hypothetical protein